jgi:hypothetical protein
MIKLPSADYLEGELSILQKSAGPTFDFIQEATLAGLWYGDLQAVSGNRWANAKFWQMLGYEKNIVYGAPRAAIHRGRD